MTSSSQSADAEMPEEDPRGDLRWGSVPGLVSDAARRFGDAEAVADVSVPGSSDPRRPVRISFAELETRALHVTRAAIAAGIHPGDRVALWAPNSAQWVVCACGLLGAGAVLVPLNTRFKGPEAAYILSASGARALFSARGFLGTDYPAMLETEEVPGIERIVLLDGTLGTGTGAEDEDRTGDGVARDLERAQSQSTSGDEVPVFGWHEFLQGAEGVVESTDAVVGVSVTDRDARERWDAVQGDALSDVIFTSGTTGRPKGATATHAQSLRTFATWASIVGLEEGDRYLVVNPFFHTFGYKAGILACLMTGATILPEAALDVERLMRTVESERVSVLPGPPTLYQSLLAHRDRSRFDLSSLRLAVTGAAMVPVELVREMGGELGFSTVLTAYGLTESTGVVTMCRRGDDAETIATTSGRAIPDLEVRVAGDSGDELPHGEPGEVLVRGYTVTSGYFGDPGATAETVDASGWLHTGDVGVMDEHGNLRITDRKKDMFVVGGFNAYPAEIEQALAAHPGVAQVAVVGVADDRLGEVGCAFVVPRTPDQAPVVAGELARWARERMANYKVPRYVEVVDALPLNASGKVLKTELRSRFAGSGSEGGGPA